MPMILNNIDSTYQLQNCLTDLHNWQTTNDLLLNSDKTDISSIYHQYIINISSIYHQYIINISTSKINKKP